MALDFQQVRQQIIELGEKARERAERLREQRQLALKQLTDHADDLENLRQKVQLIARNYDPNLRCALPAYGPLAVLDALDSHHPLPGLPDRATVLAADGSQIAPDRHAPVDYCLINVGAIQMEWGSAVPPRLTVSSQLLYDEQLYSESVLITEASLALMRDLHERKMLAELARQAGPPVITFTDGPMELWGAKDGASETEFQRSLEEYQRVLAGLCESKVVTAGYVDKPAANLVVRLLEVGMLAPEDLPQVRKLHPLRGVLDRHLYQGLLAPGERSAVFAIQSRSAQQYRDELTLHFFYLNVGRPNHPWLARVEIPAWVATDQKMLEDLHSTLVHQCQVLGSRPYPYLLHRAHESAVVSLEEKEQVTQMIALELHQRGLEVGETSYKQSAKDLGGRTRYERK
jgi:hypothetical protein